MKPVFAGRAYEVTRLEGFTRRGIRLCGHPAGGISRGPKDLPRVDRGHAGVSCLGICFALLAVAWYEHYRYFRRYGLETAVAVILNCALLFCVLLYVYPLKFMFTAVIGHTTYTEREIRTLFTIFGSGFTAVFGVFWLLYRYAWSCPRGTGAHATRAAAHAPIDHG